MPAAPKWKTLQALSGKIVVKMLFQIGSYWKFDAFCFLELLFFLHLAEDWRYSKSLESLLEVLLNLRSFFLIKEAESIYAMFLRFWNVTLRNYNSYKSWAKSLPYTECTSDKWRSYWPNKMLQIDIPFVEQPVISLILLTVIITSWIYGSHKEKLVNHMKMSACSLWYEQSEDFFSGWRLLICCLPAVVSDGTL